MIEPRDLALADAVMYEGALLYPYRRSALKNRHRWTFGVIPPRGAARDATQPPGLAGTCLLSSTAASPVDVVLRFMIGEGMSSSPQAVNARATQGVERTEFSFGRVSGALVVERTPLGDGYERLRVCALNRVDLGPATSRDTAFDHTMFGVHALLCAGPGCRFVSLTDPGIPAEPYAAMCEPDGLYCILLGPQGSERHAATAMLAPIILPDFPEIAPESCGTLCDATEIDEMLALRIRALTDAEKREARAEDPRVGEMFDRVESLSDAQILQLHGARRAAGGDAVDAGHSLLGAHVTLRPRRSADAIDILLSGRKATVHAVERDVEGNTLLCVLLDEDPGRDLGAGGLPGHRFFFAPDEVEVL